MPFCNADLPGRTLEEMDHYFMTAYPIVPLDTTVQKVPPTAPVDRLAKGEKCRS